MPTPTLFWDSKRKLKKCRNCKKSKNKHRSNGLCTICFWKLRYKNPRYKKTHDKSVYKWMRKNPEAVKTIRTRATIKYSQTEKGRAKHKEAQDRYLINLKIRGTKKPR